MKAPKKFDIELFRLNSGKQEFEYDIDNKFFEFIEQSIVEKGTLKAKVFVEKFERHILMEFKISGKIELQCDRSLEPFDFTINKTAELVIKFGDTFEEVSEDVIIIPKDYPKLNIAQYIYEFISIEVPMKKLHPKFQNEQEDDDEVKLIYQSGDDNESDKNNEEVDPRWNILKNLNNNLN